MKNKDLLKMLGDYKEENEVKIFVKDGVGGDELDISFVYRDNETVFLQGDINDVRRNEKKLRVAHFPQVPCKAFVVEVKSLEEAKLISDTLANYDLFQFENKIKPDYANATVVEEFDEEEQEWVSWSDEETGIDDFDEYLQLQM